MIRNIVFDMGGVILDFNVKKTVEEYFPEEYREIVKKNVFDSELWRSLDRGTLEFSEALPLMLKTLPKETHALVKDMVTDFYPYMPPFDDMYDFIASLKKAGYKTYLLSNASVRVFDRFFNIPALSLLDGLFISALYGYIKPEKEIYEAFFKKFSLVPEECFFIDDNAVNVEAAKKLGMDGYVYKAPDISGLKTRLSSLGVKI